MRVVATGVIAVVFVFALVTSSGWLTGPRTTVQVVAIPGLLLAALDMVKTTRDSRRRSDATADPGSGNGAAAAAGAEPDGNTASAGSTKGIEFQYLLWMLGYLLATWLLGLSVSSPLFTLAYLKAATRKGWVFSGVSAAVVFLVTGYVLQDLFHTAVPRGELFYWLF